MDDLPGPDSPDHADAPTDAAALKSAHGRAGRMFQTAGLPFDDDEFDEEDGDETSESSTGS